MALAWALRGASSFLPYEFRLGHINHKLRGRHSDQDARFVKNLAVELNWPCDVVSAPISLSKSGNLEEKARQARYQALLQLARKHKCRFILTAHHLDDQVETILMNFFRGAGLKGLGGMRDQRVLPTSDVVLVRPFLDVDKKRILSFLKSQNAQFRLDQSNQSPKFFRNWLRTRIVPTLETKSPGFKKSVGRLAAIVRDEEEYWDQLMTDLGRQLLRRSGPDWLLDFKKLLRYPAAVQRRFLRRTAGGDLLSFDAVERWRRWMSQPPSSGRLWQLRKGWIAERLSKSKGAPSATLFKLRSSLKDNNIQ